MITVPSRPLRTNELSAATATQRMKGGGLQQKRVCVVSRCARTLYVFRRDLISEAMRCGASVTTFGAAGDGFEDLLQRDGVEFHHIPVSLRGLAPYADLRLLFELTLAFHRASPDVVHAFTIKPAIYGTIAAWLVGVPRRVVTITGLGHAFTTGGWTLRAVAMSLYRFALSKAHVVFFQNKDDRELFVRRGLVYSDRARLVPGSGVDLGHFVPVPLPGTTGSAPRFLMIARLLREKGVQEFVEAARIVKLEYPAASFALLGNTDSRNPSSLSPEKLKDLRTSSSVEWIDEVADVRPYIAAADVIVLPSYREGLPRTLLEGAAMGRAIIATDAPGCRELVMPARNGYLVPIGDPRALADAMKRLCESRELIPAFGRASRTLVEENFDQKIVLDAYMQAYGRNTA